MTTLYIDADACPVKDECLRVAERHGVAVKIVCNGGIRPNPHPLVEVVVVPEGPDVADDWIAERIGAGDVCVTGDIPLAARCVEAGGRVIKHDGETLTATNVGAALATRNLMADLRSANPLLTSGGGKPYSRQDRARFLDRLETVLRAATKEAGL